MSKMMSIIDQLLGEGSEERIQHCLKNDCKIDIGFVSQRIGSKKLSATTTAIITYVLAVFKLLDDNEKKQLLDEIQTFRITDGYYQNAYGITDDITTWSTSQICLALHSLGVSYEIIEPVLEWIVKAQNKDGGWSLNGREWMPTRIEYALYPLIVLSKYRDKSEKISNSLIRAKTYIVESNPTTIYGKIVQIFLLENIFGISIGVKKTNTVLRVLRRELIKGYTSDKIVDSDDSHFYVEFYLPAYYLLLRSFINPIDPIALYLMKYLKNTMLSQKGWAPAGRLETYSWTTALAYLSLRFWAYDCKKLNYNIDSFISRMESISLRNITMQTFIEKCPLNDGICNKLDEIVNNFNENKIFMDIPYCDEYLTFEEELVRIIKNSDMEPVMGKDTINSKVVLCKICQMIQESRFGLADVSYPTYNIPFELGLMMGLNKCCAILKRKDAELPSDLKGIEYIEYKNTRDMREKLSKWINDNK